MQVVYQLLKEVAYQRDKEHGRAAPKHVSQDADHGYQLNNIGFIDNISIFAENPEGMQTLLDVVQDFTT